MRVCCCSAKYAARAHTRAAHSVRYQTKGSTQGLQQVARAVVMAAAVSYGARHAARKVVGIIQFATRVAHEASLAQTSFRFVGGSAQH